MDMKPLGVTTIAGDDSASKIRDLRASIDNIDAAVVHMLAERFRCTRAIGELKARCGLPARDPSRHCEQVARLRHLAAVSNLDPEFTEKFLTFVSEEVIRQHELFGRSGAEDAHLPHPLAERTTARDDSRSLARNQVG